jgi:hypothetical protein
MYGNKSEVWEISMLFTQLHAGRRMNEPTIRVHVEILRSASYGHQIHPPITWFINIDCEWNGTRPRKPLTKAAGAASRCHSRSSSHDPRLLKLSAQIHVAWSAFKALESDLLPCVPTKLGRIMSRGSSPGH